MARTGEDIKTSKARRVRFEKRASQVVFDPISASFVVTWAKCGLRHDERMALARDPLVYIPSIGAIATLYDRGCIPQEQMVAAAKSIGRAWRAGDRETLDTEGAKKAAELISDISYICDGPSSPNSAKDMGQAIRNLLDEMASVRFADVPLEMFDEKRVMGVLDKAISECLSVEGFTGWPSQSMRRRFMFCLNRRERTPVTYTLVSLMFDVGACPLLRLRDRRTLRMMCMRDSLLSSGMSRESMLRFFGTALSVMRKAKESGNTILGERITSQQLTDMLSDSSDDSSHLKK